MARHSSSPPNRDVSSCSGILIANCDPYESPRWIIRMDCLIIQPKLPELRPPTYPFCSPPCLLAPVRFGLIGRFLQTKTNRLFIHVLMTILYVSVDILASHAVCIEVPPERTVRDDFLPLYYSRLEVPSTNTATLLASKNLILPSHVCCSFTGTDKFK